MVVFNVLCSVVFIFRVALTQDRTEVMSSGIAADWTGLFKMKKSNFRLLLLLAFYGLFLILGAAIFSAIESPLEVAEVKNMRDRKNHFLRTHTCVTGKSSSKIHSINKEGNTSNR